METELDGRLLALRQALAISIALSTRGHPQATAMALELLDDLRQHADNSPADAPFDAPAWVQGAQDELEQISALVQAFTRAGDEPA
ncbi:hypothetical protein [Bordetella genomosp. 12]|uniref:Uncharacterized protein n=1 Tax=Bordetella genomosp. 12 TaxID=463035 RepID=A0A261VAG1_9BORD|nr:hypothetical protein [Bordetella genomosp. 12]OZI70751.1 hypothetical protein CAL22_12600 [Bordetella genomosp. 12]